MFYRFICKKITAFLLLLGTLAYTACSHTNSDGDDEFITIDFDFSYPLLADKSFSFSSPPHGFTVSGSECLAVAWEGEINDVYYYGFSVRSEGIAPDGSDTFHLMVWFKKNNDNALYGHIEREAGDYWVSMRLNNDIYYAPSSKLDIDIFKITGTHSLIRFNGGITLTEPSAKTISAAADLYLRNY